VATYDLIILGGGTGGYTAAIRARQLGLRVALVERERVGGVCLHIGCIPTKALLRSAEIAELVRNASRFGVTPREVQLDFAQAMRRAGDVVAQLYEGLQGLLRKHAVEVFSGIGRLADAHTVVVGGQQLTAAQLILATGSRPRPLPGTPFDGRVILSSDHLLQKTRVPASLLIIGAGAVGVEMATVYAAFGSTVTLLERETFLVPQEDPEVSRELLRQFDARGIRSVTGVRLQSLAVSPRGAHIALTVGEERTRIEAEWVLVAIGRVANVDDIGLEAAGIALDEGWIQIDAMNRTTQSHIFAIGDCVKGPMMAHRASFEAARVVEMLAGQRPPEPYDRQWIPRCTFSQPEIASVGLTEPQARAQGLNVRAGRFFLQGSGKAWCDGTPEGFVKLLTEEATGRLIGAHLIGPHINELISQVGLMHHFQGAIRDWEATIAPHPAIAEALREAALDTEKRAIHR